MKELQPQEIAMIREILYGVYLVFPFIVISILYSIIRILNEIKGKL